MLAELGHEASVVGVARLYAPIAAALVIDPVDADLAAGRRGGRACGPSSQPSVMSTPAIAAALARAVPPLAARRPLSASAQRRRGPRRSVVHGDQPRWMRARTGDTAKRSTSSGRAAAWTGSGAVRGDQRPQVAQRRLHAGADVDDEPAAALARPHEGVDDVVDVDEVAALAPVARQPRRLARARRRRRARRRPRRRGAGAARTPTTAASAVNSMPEVLAVGAEQVDDRLGDDAAHAARGERALLDRQVAPGRVAVERRSPAAPTTTLVTPDRRAASSTPSIDVNERPSSIGRLAVAGDEREVEHLARAAHRDQAWRGRRCTRRACGCAARRRRAGPPRPGPSARLASEPVERSSTTSTGRPSAISRSTRWEPTNPAPPMTSTPPVRPLAVAGSSAGVGRRRRRAGRRQSTGSGTRASRSCSRVGILASAPTTVRTTTASGADDAGDDRVLDDGAGADPRARAARPSR